MSNLVDNRQHIDCTDGQVFLNGEQCMDATAYSITFTPVVSTTKTLGHTGEDSRWKGFTVKVHITEYRSRDWLKQAIKNFMENKVTPEFTITGKCEDTQSDYYNDGYGEQKVTVTGCIPTGDLTVLAQDVDSDFMTDSIDFTGKWLYFDE